ncbi:hypothetical protein H6G54_01520 [Anabaena cylindrica FACHB-243]|uniref:Uncharacterized protein n=1 Tax=Anabaena cylindrica (strain ATCC 27899 / PCC 7122) TaxID=272123 RepID=K9ZPZ9_ANACC|nr:MULTISPECIES: hypothetical protein [Anabaena]AFZ60425.1 hypothetical protein Anacy_5089 [Anabaena cylindrica PCC 7122]MBD2416413.1 hypothetical protein [Anabaena cylindrica FACHB-243]MBY5280555.1 hypothetical protein [Anabaena sp. CCAP 1446/1C]MBY5309040.1 hypothetical protein [Anabaena sp. CCAP 1446/1C]MCM2408466.1 hypothetical protein [Anabaena sp. CCAP 1446/1C]
MKLLNSTQLTIEIPSEKTLKSQARGGVESAVFFFIVCLPIYLFLFFVSISAHDPGMASIMLIFMILHIGVFLVPYLIEPIINNRILFHVVHFIVMLPIYLIMFFGLISYTYPLLAFIPLILMILHLGIRVVGAIQKFLEPFFFIEKIFKVYEHTKEAQFFIKNNRWYLALFHGNGIEIYDVLKGNIVIQQEEDFTLEDYEKFTLKYYDKFIMTYSRIVDNKDKDRKFLIKVWDVNKLVLECITDRMNRFFFTKNKKYFICCMISSQVYEDQEGPIYYSIKIYELKSGQVIYDNFLSIKYSKFEFTDEDLKSKIKDILKSYKEVSELDKLCELDEPENTPLPYPIAIIFPSCKKKYNGDIEYDMKKVRQDKFTEKATCIRVKIPLKELK